MGSVSSKRSPILATNGVNYRQKGKNSCIFSCFQMFCPPSASDDPFGTPLSENPSEERKLREMYGDLEFEDGDFGAVNNIAKASSRTLPIERKISPNVITYDGKDGEHRLLEKYQLCEVLGVGSTSICHRCVERSTGKNFACKLIDKVKIEEQFEGMLDQFRTEIESLKVLQHPNIVKLYDVYTTATKMYIVMEYMPGGELFDYIVQKGTLTESEASSIVRMVTSALAYMHDQNIIHRDLKPENLLLTHKPTSIYDIQVKIIDFGLSKSLSEPFAQSFLGTKGYLAPEMLQRRSYAKTVDTWALGVIVFVLLCGCLPFDDDSTIIPSDSMVRSKFHLRFPRWAHGLSASAKDLLSHLLDTNPQTRYTAHEALQHPWVQGNSAPKDSLLQSPGRLSLANKKKSDSPFNLSGLGKRIETRTQMTQIISERARANSGGRPGRHLVRKKSI